MITLQVKDMAQQERIMNIINTLIFLENNSKWTASRSTWQTYFPWHNVIHIGHSDTVCTTLWFFSSEILLLPLGNALKIYPTFYLSCSFTKFKTFKYFFSLCCCRSRQYNYAKPKKYLDLHTVKFSIYVQKLPQQSFITTCSYNTTKERLCWLVAVASRVCLLLAAVSSSIRQQIPPNHKEWFQNHKEWCHSQLCFTYPPVIIPPSISHGILALPTSKTANVCSC